MNLISYDIYIIFYIFYMYISHIYYLQIFFHSLLHTDERVYFFTLMTTLTTNYVRYNVLERR